MAQPRPRNAHTDAFYREALTALTAAETPFLVGGAYALDHYTGLFRDTKDLDLFLRRSDLDRAFAALASIGCRTELTFPHWLGKAHRGGDLVDFIFSSGNGVAGVDDDWFHHATHGDVLGVSVAFCPAEEMIWSKAFIMERERFDGHDVVHLIRARGSRLSWPRLLARFDRHWPVLLAHLVLYGFVYPNDHSKIPGEVLDELVVRLERQGRERVPDPAVCQGTLLSRAQYLVDVERWGLRDARLAEGAALAKADLRSWNEDIPPEVRPSTGSRGS